MTKSFYWIVCLMGIALVSCSDKEEVPDIARSADDPLFVRTKEGIITYGESPFSGYQVNYYPDSSIATKQGYSNGRAHGKYIGYYADGKKSFERWYEGGEKEGIHMGWYPNGQMKFRYTFEEGLNVGVHLEWYENGDPYSEHNYKEGREFGPQHVWRKDGKYRANYVVKEDGREYGLTGLKRCKKIDAENEKLEPIKPEQ